MKTTRAGAEEMGPQDRAVERGARADRQAGGVLPSLPALAGLARELTPTTIK